VDIWKSQSIQLRRDITALRNSSIRNDKFKIKNIDRFLALLQTLLWRFVNCAIHHKRDVREEQQYKSGSHRQQ